MLDLLPDQRRKKIAEHVRAEGVVRVAALAAEFAVTEETVRRDLKELDRLGILVRQHGGATAVDTPASVTPALAGDVPFEARRAAMSAQKRSIAREALHHVRADQVIALDGSTTAWELARLLDLPRLTVVTNSLVITNLLATRNSVQVICLGGTLDTHLQSFGGIIAEQALQRLNIDQAFFSCGGIDADRGLSDPTHAASQFKRQLIELAGRTTLLADSSKFAARAVVLFAGAGDIDEIITDAGAPQDALSKIAATGVKCSVVQP